MIYTRLYCKIYDFAISVNLTEGGKTARAAVHTALSKAFGFYDVFDGIANNCVVCNRGQYITEIVSRKN